MQDFTYSFVIGLICTTTLFILCLFLVVGAKSIYISIKRIFSEKFSTNTTPQPTPAAIKKSVRKRKRKVSPITSIEIDPDKIDRIYVKKVS